MRAGKEEKEGCFLGMVPFPLPSVLGPVEPPRQHLEKTH